MTDSRISRRQWLMTAAALATAPMLADFDSARTASALPRQHPSGLTHGTEPLMTVAGQGGAVLRSAESFGAPTLDPVGPINSYVVLYGMGETLMRLTPDGAVEPWLAERVDQIDALRWRVRLRSGVTFWNGRAMDAEAVRSSLLRTVAKRPASAALLDLSSVEVVDPLTLDLITRRPNGALLSSLTASVAIVHDAEHAAAVGDDAFGIDPICTGPYIPTAFKVRESVSAKPYDNYWGGAPQLGGIDFKAVSDGNARLAAVLAGDVEIARPIATQSVTQARSSGLQVVSGNDAGMYHIYLNNTRAPFDEVAVRQAVSLAIDRKLLVDGVLEGSGLVANGLYASYFPFAAKSPLPYDPAQAGAILDGVGWTLGSGGVRARSGQALQFTLLTYPQVPELGLLATVIQAQLQQVGITATIQSVEQITSIVSNRDFEATMWRLPTAPTGDPGFILNTVYSSTGADNRHLGYSSARMDALVDRLNGTAETAQRYAIAAEAESLLREEVPAVYLMTPQRHVAMTPRLQSYVYHPNDFYLVSEKLALA